MRLVPEAEAAEDAQGVLHLCVLEPGGAWSPEVPLRYLGSGGDLLVLAPEDPEPRWARSLAASLWARWRIGDQVSGGSVQLIDNRAELDDAFRRFSARFGPQEVRRWFPDDVRAYRLKDTVGSGGGYVDEVEEYFDHLAPQYDAGLDTNPLDRAMRVVSTRVLVGAFHPEDFVLEIGCGTGWETLPLARRGVRLLATDVSSEMLHLLDQKAASEGLSKRVRTRKLAVHDLATLLEEFPPGSFDGAFSDFGALNCEPDTSDLPALLHRLVRPGGRVVLGVWNRFCASEAILAVAAGRPNRVLARLETPVPVGRSRYGLPVFAHAAGEFLEGFRPFFEVQGITGLPVFVPPYDFVRAFEGRSNFLAILERLDARLAGRFPFNRIGDHFLAVLRRRP